MVKKILSITGAAGALIGLIATWVSFGMLSSGFFEWGYVALAAVVFTAFFVGICLTSFFTFIGKENAILPFAISSVVVAVGLLSGMAFRSDEAGVIASIFFAASGIIAFINVKKNSKPLTFVLLGLFAIGMVLFILSFNYFVSILGIISIVFTIAGPVSLIFAGEFVPRMKTYSPKIEKDQVIIEKDVDSSFGEPYYWKENGFTYADRP